MIVQKGDLVLCIFSIDVLVILVGIRGSASLYSACHSKASSQSLSTFLFVVEIKGKKITSRTAEQSNLH